MNADTLMTIASELGSLVDHLDYLHNIARPCVDIELVSGLPTPECSRLGGDAYVPTDFQWPLHNKGEYLFLGQINFAEVFEPPSMLPQSGLLSFFYAYDEDGEIFWRNDGYVLGFYWDDLHRHAVMKSPTGCSAESRRLQLTGGLDLPRHSELRDDWPFDKELLYELSTKLDPNDAYLLGYPSFTSLGYDPTPGPEWMSLLTVHSLDEFDWCWHDGDKLMVFIQREDLASRVFSHLKCDAG